MFNAIIQLMRATANEQQRASLHALVAGELYNDYCRLQNILLGYDPEISSIDHMIINHAEEYYKQWNKALLVFRDLSFIEKQVEESRIDSEAMNLKNKWIQTLRDRYIRII